MSAERDALGRRRAVAVAGHTGDAPTARAALDDHDDGVRASALAALARVGALRDADLRRALCDASPAVRRRGCEVAAAVGSPNTPGGWSLLGLLDDPDPAVVEVAAWASGELDPSEDGAVAHLATLATTHDDALVREAATAALGAIGDPAGLDAVLVACTDKATVRRRAVLALAAFDDPRVDPALHDALADRDRHTRQYAEDLLQGWGR